VKTFLVLFCILASFAVAADEYLGKLSVNPYDGDSTSNPYGQHGSQYSAGSINNPYGQFGSRYSNDSATNPYATNAPDLYDSSIRSKYKKDIRSDTHISSLSYKN